MPNEHASRRSPRRRRTLGDIIEAAGSPDDRSRLVTGGRSEPAPVEDGPGGPRGARPQVEDHLDLVGVAVACARAAVAVLVVTGALVGTAVIVAWVVALGFRLAP